MTLHSALKVIRHRWLVITLCTVVAAAVMWVVTPANPPATPPARTYTATATMLVDSSDDPNAQMGRIALFLKTGDIPRRAAQRLGYDGDPAILASGLTVTPDFTAAALTVAVTAADGDRAAAVANAFADATVEYFDEQSPGAGNGTVTNHQAATPIPNADTGGFVVPPGRTARTAVAATLGLLLGLAVAFLLEHLDSRLRTRQEIAEALGLPIVAEVPRLSRTKRHAKTIGVAEEPLSVYADAYRGARSAIDHTATLQHAGAGPQEPGPGGRTSPGARLVLVTSAYPAEGKTTSVANLAASFAEAGQRVLVLDADLRSPDTHTLFDVPQGAGISDYLSRTEDSSLEALARPTSVAGVRIITAGTRLAHPASLASLMGGLLATSRDLADVVLIDTAPLLVASDVFDLLPLVDTVVVVARHGRITAAAGHRVSELLRRFHVPVAGVVIVGMPTSGEARYGYGYGYARSDSGGYGEQRARTRLRGGRPGRSSAEPDRVEEPAPDAVASRRDRRTSSA